MNIYDDCYDILTENRPSEHRAAPFLDLVTLLLEYGYEDALSEIYLNPIPSPQEETVRYEQIILRGAVSLLGKLGVGVDVDVAYTKPKEMVRLIQGLTSAFEDYEDRDTLYGIVLSGETPDFILEQLIRQVYGDNDLYLDDLVVNVEPRVINVMQSFLAAWSLDQTNNDADASRTARMANYLRGYPDNPSAWLFLNLSAQPDLVVVAQQLDFDEDNGVPLERLLVIYSVGLSLINNDTFNGAYADLENNLASINNDGYPTNTVLKDAYAGLKAIYEADVVLTGSDDEED